MSDCTCRFLVNSGELIGLLLLFACVFESLLLSVIGTASIVDTFMAAVYIFVDLLGSVPKI